MRFSSEKDGLRLFNQIRPGSRVTIITPQGSKLTGRATMRGPFGWVLNLGGRYGTPGIATDENIIKVQGGGRVSGETRIASELRDIAKDLMRKK